MHKFLRYLLGGWLMVTALNTQGTSSFSMTSPAFHDGGSIPSKYTCDGENISPPLAWQSIPGKTQSLILIVDDPDAPVSTWDHWVLFNIPANTTTLDENISSFPTSTKIGSNSWGKQTYGGPCPPKGTHRYFFKLYALDISLDLKEGSSKKALETAMKNHILGQATLMGRYQRKAQ